MLILQTEAWLPVTGGLNRCHGVATKKVTSVSVAISGDKKSSVDVSHSKEGAGGMGERLKPAVLKTDSRLAANPNKI